MAIKRTGNRMSALVMLACMLACVPGATAQTISGVGARDCPAYLFALDKESDEAIDSYVAWAQGFVSATNVARAPRRDLRLDADSIVVWIGQFCAANPKAAVFDALRALTAETER